MVVSVKDADKVCNKCFTSHIISNCLYIFVGFFFLVPQGQLAILSHTHFFDLGCNCIGSFFLNSNFNQWIQRKHFFDTFCFHCLFRSR